jgi:glycosyltransferase involved in cell wall biosynthesis
MGSPVRVLFSFPHKIGADRICSIAWYQVAGVTDAGGEVLACPGAVHRPLPANVRVSPTLGRGRFGIPYRVIGRQRAFALHDAIVARRLPRLAKELDVVHAWPVGARRTLEAAARLGIPTVLERPNAHTRFAYEVVRDEADRLGVALPANHEHAYNDEVLRIEEEEYRLADYLLCPSDFVVRTFLDQGFPPEKLLRHSYGFDERVFRPADTPPEGSSGLTMLFVGVAAVRKGLHFALEAWLRSPASRDGTFLIAGEVLPAYGERLANMLVHPSVQVLGHRTDVPDLMRRSDVLVLPSIEEGFGLVCVEAMGSGCVPLVSDACTDACRHMETALVHHVGDVDALESHITAVHEDRALLATLRAGAIAAAPRYTWTAVGVELANVYRDAASPVRPTAAATA